jgi:phosphatidylinositol-3-phosphatase
VDNPGVSRPSIPRLGAAIAALLAFGVAMFGGSAPSSALGTPTNHLVIIVMENKEYGSVFGSPAAPYINNTLIPTSRLFTKYYAEEHPSLPNYLALSSAGSAGCVLDNCPVGFDNQENLFHQMDTAGKSWKAYQESMPSNCFPSNQGAYLVRHNPPPYYANLSGSCAQKDVPFTQFATDLQAGNLPQFSWITPNKYNDMHSDQNKAPCQQATATLREVCQGDTWLSQNLPPLLALNTDGDTGNDVTVILTFDEGSSKEGGGGRVLTLVKGPNIAQSQDATMYGHLGLLNAIEDWFGLTQLHPTVLPV